MFRGTVLCAALAVALVAGSALAETERLPTSGSPALEIDVPDGWTATRDKDGSLFVVSSDHTGVIVCTMAVIDDSTSMDTIAAGALVAAKAQPYTRSEPAEIGGSAGKAYYSTSTNDAGVGVQIRLVLARVDATHVIAETELNSSDAPAAQVQALYALAASARIVR